MLPVFFSYVQSFWIIGVYWNNHHHLLHTLKKVSGKVMLANMFLLFMLSFVPFATGWVGESDFATIPVAIYAVVLLLCGFSFTILQLIIKNTSDWNPAIKKAMDSQNVKGITSVALYTTAIPIAFVNPLISEGLFVFVAIMWLIPDKNIEKAFSQE